MRKVRNIVWLVLIALLGYTNSYAQELQSFVVSTESMMKVEGTSSLHDWHCDVVLEKGSMACSEENGKLVPQKLQLVIPVKNMDSGKGMMNRLIYKSMKEEEHPNINYLLKNVKLSENYPSDKLARYVTIGELEIAGAKKEVEMTVDMLKNVKGEYLLEGSKVLKMTDFGIEPPTAMFGTVTTGDEITVHFNLNLTAN